MHAGNNKRQEERRWEKVAKKLGSASIIFATLTGLIYGVTHWSDFCEQRLWCRKEYPIQDYLTKDPGKAPRLQSTEWKLLGVEEGMTTETIASLMPAAPETVHSVSGLVSDSGKRSESWLWEGIYISVEVDDAGSTSNVKIAVHPDSEWLASAPNGLLLGHSTVADLYVAGGEPLVGFFGSQDASIADYLMGYTWGSEGARQIVYEATALPEDDGWSGVAMDPELLAKPGSVYCRAVIDTVGIGLESDGLGVAIQDLNMGSSPCGFSQN